MTTSIPRTTDQGNDKTSTLDRRRAKAQSAKDAAEGTQTHLTELDARLAANTAKTKQDQAALARAQDEVTRLKRALKTSAKARTDLFATRKKAQSAATKARLKADGAEIKYDQVVLAEIVRREKERDRSGASAAVSSPAMGNAPAAERPSTATVTATRTAARKTAATAGTDGADAAGSATPAS